jgi:hypothetical protein
VTGIQLDGLLQMFQRKRELLVIKTDPPCEPRHEPIPWRKNQRLLETVIGSLFPAGEQHVAPRQPDVRRVSVLFD